MRFDIEYTVDLEPAGMQTAMFGNEPDNTLIQYHMAGDYAENRSAKITQGQYDTLADDLKDEPPRMTGAPVSRIGVKSLVGLGAYGFYVSQNEQGVYTRILIPINVKSGGPPPTLLELGETDTTLTFSIRNPDIIDYECFRLTFRQGNFAHEFISYDLAGEVEKPFDMEGEYSVTVIGYKNEISEFSEPTEPVDFTVEKRSDAPPDIPYIDMEAVREAIAQQIATISNRLLPPGGVMNESLVKASDDNYDAGWSLIEGGTGGGIEEAPVDDGLYGRRNAAWEAIPGFAPPPPVVISAIASQFWSSAQYPTFHAPWNAVEELLDSVDGGGGWLTNTGISTGWIRIVYNKAWRAISVTLRATPDEPGWMPRNFQIIGIGDANANSPRETLATFVDLPVWGNGQVRTYTFDNNAEYEAYELNIHVSSSTRIYVNRIQFDYPITSDPRLEEIEGMIDARIETHNTHSESHQDIRNLIPTNISEIFNTLIQQHNASETSHPYILALIDELRELIDAWGGGGGIPDDWLDIVKALIAQHNVDLDAHPDIRALLGEPVVPGPPQNLEAEPLLTTINLRWYEPAYSESPIEGYQVSVDGGQWLDAPTNTYSLTGLNRGQTCRFRVRAVNEHGHGEPAVIMVTTRPGATSATVSSFSMTAHRGDEVLTDPTTQIELAGSGWSAAATPAWVRMNYAAPWRATQCLVRAWAPDAWLPRTARDFQIRGIRSGETTVLLTVTGQTGWAGNEVRTFSFENEEVFDSYEVNITAVQGSGHPVTGYIRFETGWTSGE